MSEFSLIKLNIADAKKLGSELSTRVHKLEKWETRR